MKALRFLVLVTVQICLMPLAQAGLCRQYFDNTSRALIPFFVKNSPFVNVGAPGTADLDREFVYVMYEGRRSRVTRSEWNLGASNSFLQTVVTRTTNPSNVEKKYRKIEALVLDSDVGNLTQVSYEVDSIRRNLVTTLKYLYEQRYSKNRSENIGRYRSQDRRKAQRVTRFTHLVNNEVVSHIQAEISKSRRQKLNFQELLAVDGLFEIAPGEVVGEIERFELIRERDLKPETKRKMNDLYLDRDLLFYRTLQKLVSWLNHDVGLQRAFYYSSISTQKVLEEAIPWLKVVPRYYVAQKGSTNKTEVLYDISRFDLLTIERYLLEKIVEHHLLQDLPYLNVLTVGEKAYWSWMFWPNEFATLKDIYLGNKKLFSVSSFAKEIFFDYLGVRIMNAKDPQMNQLTERQFFKAVSESLLINLDGLHVRQLANRFFDAFVAPGPAEDEVVTAH